MFSGLRYEFEGSSHNLRHGSGCVEAVGPEPLSEAEDSGGLLVVVALDLNISIRLSVMAWPAVSRCAGVCRPLDGEGGRRGSRVGWQHLQIPVVLHMQGLRRFCTGICQS